MCAVLEARTHAGKGREHGRDAFKTSVRKEGNTYTHRCYMVGVFRVKFSAVFRTAGYDDGILECVRRPNAFLFSLFFFVVLWILHFDINSLLKKRVSVERIEFFCFDFKL